MRRGGHAEQFVRREKRRATRRNVSANRRRFRVFPFEIGGVRLRPFPQKRRVLAITPEQNPARLRKQVFLTHPSEQGGRILRAAHRAVQRKHESAQTNVFFPSEIHGEQVGKLLPARFVSLFEDFVRRLCGKGVPLRVVGRNDPERGIGFRKIKIRTRKPPAKGVDRADLRKRQRFQLRLDTATRALVRFGNPLDQRGAQTVPHLRRSFVRKRERQHVLHVRAV